MLQLQNVEKTYGNGTRALDGITITIGKGMFGLLGPNGAGKSTLMRTIATLQRPDVGTVLFNEMDIQIAQNQFRRVLGYLPQDFGVYPKISAEALLDYFSVLKGISSKKDRRYKVEQVLELTNLYDVRKKHVSGYSGGMKQRFGIAQLLLNDPQLIIVDEPTAGLDPAERNRFLNVLRQVGTDNTVIFSTHIVEDVKEICTDMAILNHGKLVEKGKPLEAIQEFKDKIWSTVINGEELPRYNASFTVLSNSFTEDNKRKIRVFSKERPNTEFTQEAPNLEDVYFIQLQQEMDIKNKKQ